jgi:predicted nucleotidyltransferase
MGSQRSVEARSRDRNPLVPQHSFKMDNITKKVVEHIKERYNPFSIILHGSRAREMNKEKSDWDLYVLVKEKIDALPETFEEFGIDVEAIVVPVPDDKIISIFGGNLRVAKILFDTDYIGANLISQAEKIYKEGRKLDSRQYADRKYFVLRRLERMKMYENEPGIFFAHTAAFYGAILRYWFEVKSLWSEPIYIALPYIQKEDPIFYSWLETLYNNDPIMDKIKAAENIYNDLFK